MQRGDFIAFSSYQLQSFACEPGAGSARREVAVALAALEKPKARWSMIKGGLFEPAAAS